MGKIILSIQMEKTEAEITAQKIDAILQWVKTNVVEKVPESASTTYSLQVTS